MQTKKRKVPIPDVTEVATELTMSETWEAQEVATLIRSRSDDCEMPAFLFLGRKEVLLLQDHLAEVFGPESVTTLNDTYYLGLKVVAVDCDSYLRVGGRKNIGKALQDPISRRPAWRDRETDAKWQFRL